jgi:hypothetical protein
MKGLSKMLADVAWHEALIKVAPMIFSVACWKCWDDFRTLYFFLEIVVTLAKSGVDRVELERSG